MAVWSPNRNYVWHYLSFTFIQKVWSLIHAVRSTLLSKFCTLRISSSCRIMVDMWNTKEYLRMGGKNLPCDNFFFKGIPSFLFFIYLFIYFWLCWVLVSVRGLSLVAACGGHSSSRCAGLSCCGAQAPDAQAQ